jgi:hypothetical protein
VQTLAAATHQLVVLCTPSTARDMRTRITLIITLPNALYALLSCTYKLYRNAAGIGGESGVFRPSHSAKELTMIQPFHFSNETASGTVAHSSKAVLLSREVSYSSIAVASL